MSEQETFKINTENMNICFYTYLKNKLTEKQIRFKEIDYLIITEDKKTTIDLIFNDKILYKFLS